MTTHSEQKWLLAVIVAGSLGLLIGGYSVGSARDEQIAAIFDRADLPAFCIDALNRAGEELNEESEAIAPN